MKNLRRDIIAQLRLNYSLGFYNSNAYFSSEIFMSCLCFLSCVSYITAYLWEPDVNSSINGYQDSVPKRSSTFSCYETLWLTFDCLVTPRSEVSEKPQVAERGIRPPLPQRGLYDVLWAVPYLGFQRATIPHLVFLQKEKFVHCTYNTV